GGSVGALTTNSARLNIGIGGLTARSATFDSASTLTFVVGSSGQGGGTDLSSTGAIDLGGAQLALNSCGPLPVGQTFTLVSTTGTLTGAFGNAPNGSTFTLDECGSTSYFRIDYQETGSPQTVTATVIAPPGSFNPPRVATGPATSEVIPEVVPPNEDHHGPQAASAWLSGAIVPGDRPVSYHFEIATVPPETLNDGCAANTGSGAIRCFVTPEQQFGSGPVAQH